MGKFIKLCIGLLFAFILTGCFGEDYDVGVPTAHLSYKGVSEQLTEANIRWNTASEDVHKKIEEVEEYALSQDEIKVIPNQKVFLDFKENEENGGDIWTDPTITVALLKEGERIKLALEESGEFRFPADKGNYVLEVNFKNSAGSAQYVGNIVIESTGNETGALNGKIPEFFTSIEMPTIKKFSSTLPNGVIFDHSYEGVCWNNCDANTKYNYPDIHAGDVEIGDTIRIDWIYMKPRPTEINLMQINAENDEKEVIKEESINTTDTSLEIEVTEENAGSQYAVEFLWKEGNEVKGRSILNFRLDS